MMSKIILVPKKVISVIKINLIYSLLLLALISCASKKQSDIAIMKVIAEQGCTVNKGEKILLYPSASNEEMLKIFKENVDEQTFIRQELSRSWISHGTAQPNQETIAALKEIFTQENYSDIKKQISKQKWNKSDLGNISCDIGIIDTHDKKKIYMLKSKLSIGKPVYTKNGYALVTYFFEGIYSLVILKKIDGKWLKIQYLVLGFE
jgi:hypothetical protein